jgi:uncharacterized small protein (DUF1192 family)
MNVLKGELVSRIVILPDRIERTKPPMLQGRGTQRDIAAAVKWCPKGCAL